MSKLLFFGSYAIFLCVLIASIVIAIKKGRAHKEIIQWSFFKAVGATMGIVWAMRTEQASFHPDFVTMFAPLAAILIFLAYRETGKRINAFATSFFSSLIVGVFALLYPGTYSCSGGGIICVPAIVFLPAMLFGLFIVITIASVFGAIIFGLTHQNK